MVFDPICFVSKCSDSSVQTNLKKSKSYFISLAKDRLKIRIEISLN